LHKSRNTDVRSLIPILTGLAKEELLTLIPRFVLSATNGKSVPVFFKKLLFGRSKCWRVLCTRIFLSLRQLHSDINTHETLLTPVELLVELHRIRPGAFKEQQHLILSRP
jgi:Symplekin tight junction protein C terminal